jgi:putative DNA primase/helicase
METSTSAIAVNRNGLDFNDALPQSHWFDCDGEMRQQFLPTRTEGRLTSNDLKQRLHNRLQEALYHLFPAGKIEGKTFAIGNIQGHAGDSLSVGLSGGKAGLWHDFATGEGGDIFGLWGAVHGWDYRTQFPQIVGSIQDWLGMLSCPFPQEPGNTYKKTESQDARLKAQGEWRNGRDATGHPYLEQKKVGCHGIKEKGGNNSQRQLLIPARDIDGNLHTLQTIDSQGRKLFLKGGVKKGHFHTIGELGTHGLCYLAEGYATAASVYEATAIPTVCAFDAGNIEPVIEAIRGKYPGLSITIAADNDSWNGDGKNSGVNAARHCAKRFSGVNFTYPTFDKEHHLSSPTDFNDLHFLNGLEEVRRQISQVQGRRPEGLEACVQQEWLDPLPIRSELLPVEPFDLNLMPEPLREFVKDCSFRMQCPPDYIAVSMIFMFGGLIGAACGIKPKNFDDWVVIPNLWGGIVGNPSTLKTPAINEAFAPLYKIEKEAIEDYQEELKTWEAQDKVAKLREDSVKSGIKNQMKNKSLSDEDALQLYSDQVREIPKPACKRYKTNDGTIEKVHELLSQNPRGLIQYRDELVGLITGWEKDGHESDRAFYLEAWNGYGSFTVDRIGRGTIYADNICIAIFGSAQPDKILAYIQRSLHALENDGLLQRFQLLVYPDPLKNWEYVDRIPEQEARANYHNIAFQIARTTFFDEISDLEEVKGKKCFSFDDRAQEAFIEWLTDLEKKLKGSDEPIIIQHLAKYRKLMPALALIFHVVTIACKENKTGKITRESVVRAICWCEYLESHARRIYGMASNISAQAASLLSKKIKKGELGQKFSVREVYRKQWSLLKDKEHVEAACEELVKNHWLKEISSVPASRQRIKTEYIVNPKIGIKPPST